MRVCPTCNEQFDDDVKFCPADGTPLKPKTQNQDPMIGRRLLDRWEIIDRIGAGGFGTVYKVRDLRFDYVEALKVFDRRRLNPDEADEAIARFRREAMLLKRLGNLSQNIVGVSNMEDDEEGGFVYFTMEYVDGENLSQILVRDGSLAPDRVVAITKQICKALSVAHGYEQGIVHRDLKLENIMITRDKNDREVVKILDFGIAKAIGQQSLTNLEMGGPGTPGYAAPEQVEGREVDQRTDLFALGVVIYGMLTGREPWLGGFITEPSSGGWSLIKQAVDGEPIPAHRWDVEVPEGLETIVLKCLEKDPDDRYPSADEIWDDLDAFEKGKEIEVPERGVLRVLSEEPGVAIRVKQGRFRTVAEGRTPWEATSLDPGSYTIQVRDERYESESRDVQLAGGSEVEITLTAARIEATRERPGSILVEADREGVQVRLRDGFTNLGEGTTPWSAKGLPPGDYKVEIVDERFKKTSRSVRIISEEETSVNLSAQEKVEIPLLGKVAKLGIPLAAVAVLLIVYQVIFAGGGSEMPLSQFEPYLETERYEFFRVGDGQIQGLVQSDEGSQAVVVPLGGERLQELAQRFLELDASPSQTGSGTLLFEPDPDPGGPSSAARFSLLSVDGTEVCSDCAHGQEVEVASGWVEVDQVAPEWEVDVVTVLDPDGTYAEERVPSGQMIFVPQDDRLTLRFGLRPTELGQAIAQAEAGVGRGDEDGLREARGWVETALQIDPQNVHALAVRDDIVETALDRGRSALESEEFTLANRFATLCTEVAETDAACSDLQQQISAEFAAAQTADDPEPTTPADASAATGEEVAAAEPGPSRLDRAIRDARDAVAAGNLDAAAQAAETCALLAGGGQQCGEVQTQVAQAFLARADRRLDAGDFAAAESALERCLQVVSRFAGCTSLQAEVAYERGMAAVADGEMPAAMAAMRDCTRFNGSGGNADCAGLRRAIASTYHERATTALQSDDLAAAQTAVAECLDVQADYQNCLNVRSAVNDLTTARQALEGRDFDEARRLAGRCLENVPAAAPCTAVIETADRRQAQTTQQQPARPDPAPAAEAPTASGLQPSFSIENRRLEVAVELTAAGAPRFCAVFTLMNGEGDRPVRFTREFGPTEAPSFSVDLNADSVPWVNNNGNNDFQQRVEVFGSACGQVPPRGGTPLADWTGTACYARVQLGDWYPRCR